MEKSALKQVISGKTLEEAVFICVSFLLLKVSDAQFFLRKMVIAALQKYERNGLNLNLFQTVT